MLVIKEVGDGLQQRLQAYALPHQFPIRKTDLPRRRSRHPSVLLLARGLVLLTLQGFHVAWRSLKQQLLQCTTLLQTALHFRHQVFGNVNGESAALRPAVQHPARVLFARPTRLTARTDTWGAPQTKRAENCRKRACRLALEPAPDISR